MKCEIILMGFSDDGAVHRDLRCHSKLNQEKQSFKQIYFTSPNNIFSWFVLQRVNMDTRVKQTDTRNKQNKIKGKQKQHIGQHTPTKGGCATMFREEVFALQSISYCWMISLNIFTVIWEKLEDSKGVINGQRKWQTMIYKTLHKKLIKNNDIWSGSISSSCSTGDTHRPTVEIHEHRLIWKCIFK